MLADGFGTSRGHRAAYVHRDAVNGVLRGRKGARLTALTSGGAIPDNADYDVVLEPAGQRVGTVNEDFAVESLAGDMFQLGNTSYQIRRVEAGRVRVEDAHGQAPTIPFWLGEAPGAHRRAVARGVAPARGQSRHRGERGPAGRRSCRASCRAAARRSSSTISTRRKAALGALPTQSTIVLERFFDETGGMQLVIHSPFGSRINRAWGLALRKRFCLKFNFELQAAATEDAIVLSLSTSHSFDARGGRALPEFEHGARGADAGDARRADVRGALALDRQHLARAAALPRRQEGPRAAAADARRGSDGRGVPRPDRMRGKHRRRPRDSRPSARAADDPRLPARGDGRRGPRARCCGGSKRATSKVVARDLPTPSPLALEILTARPYAYLDDAPLEERRTQAVMARRWLDDARPPRTWASSTSPRSIACARKRGRRRTTRTSCTTRCSAWASSRRTKSRAATGWSALAEALAVRRNARDVAPVTTSLRWCVAAERLPQLQARASGCGDDAARSTRRRSSRDARWTRDDALVEIVRRRLEGAGPVTVGATCASRCGVPARRHRRRAGHARGARRRDERIASRRARASRNGATAALLARIHRYTVKRLREEIEPVVDAGLHALPAALAARRARRAAPGAGRARRGDRATAGVRGARCRVGGRDPSRAPRRLRLHMAGRSVPVRARGVDAAHAAGHRAIAGSRDRSARRRSRCCRDAAAPVWTRAGAAPSSAAGDDRARARSAVADYLREHGASFFDEIVDGDAPAAHRRSRTRWPSSSRSGLVTSDSFAGLRALLTPSDKRKPFGGGSGHRAPRCSASRTRGVVADQAARGRRTRHAASRTSSDAVEHIVHALLRRYGVVFWRMLQREAAWLPPWRELLRVLRRLEARGDIRGGRFVAGVSGEQFALPEAVKVAARNATQRHDRRARSR